MSEFGVMNSSDRWYKQIFNNVHIGVLIVDEQRYILSVNQACCNILGYEDPSEIVGQPVKIIHISEAFYRKFGALGFDKVMNKESLSFRYRFRRKDGSTVWIEVSGQPDETQRGVLWTLVNIDAQVEAEEAMQNSERKFRLLADHTLDWEYWVNTEGQYVYLSPACERITGYKPAEFIKNPALLSLLAREDYSEIISQHRIQEQVVESPLFSMEFPIITKDGEEKWIEHNCKPIFDEQGRAVGRRGNNRDITERKQAEEALKLGERRFKSLAELTFEGILIHKDALVMDMNDALCNMVGYTREEALQKQFIEIAIPEKYHPLIKKKIIQNNSKPYEIELRKKDGTLIPVELESRIVHEGDNDFRVTAVRDISERKKNEAERLKFEDQLRQKHKMEAVGYMAGGMAHNFNNNLSIILGNVELAQLKQSCNSEVIPLLENAKIAVKRSRDLVLKIITYSRQSIQRKVSTQLTSIIDETILLLQATLPATINLQKSYDPSCDSKFINADPSQIQEILINLSNNAVHAMEEKGELKIALGPVKLKQNDIPAQYDSLPGDYAKFSVQDTGCGISPELIDHIFDPFFSTKEEYEGAGMGLATVQGLVAQHGGVITVESTPGQGTIFNLYFPIVDATATESIDANSTLPKGT